MIYKNSEDNQPKRGFSANISELDNLLDDLNTARPNLPKSNILTVQVSFFEKRTDHD